MHHFITGSLLALSVAGASTAALAQTAADPLATGRVLSFSLGGALMLNTLQVQLETTNNIGAGPFPAGPTLTGTDILDIGAGGRVAIGYGQDLANGTRLFVTLSGSRTLGDTSFTAAGGSFPGSFDDGFTTVGGTTYAFDIEHHHVLMSAGADIAEYAGFTIGVGLQAGALNQSTGINAAAIARTIDIEATNRMFGLMARASQYTALNAATGIRVTGSMGLLSNRYDYSYVTRSAGVANQQINASGTDAVLSVDLSVQLEHALSDDMFVTGAIGYEGFYGVMNGLDTFLDYRGTATTAFIEGDHIGSGYLTVGIVRRF